MDKIPVDTISDRDILTPEEVALFLRKSPSWVYKHARELGGRKLGGSLFFPNKEDLYELLFSQGQGVEIRLHPERNQADRGLVRNKNQGQKSRSRKKGGNIKSEGRPCDGDRNRHGLFGSGKPEA